MRLALRACFLAQLAHLAEQGRIVLARFKTNRDYERELNHYAHVHGDQVRLFQEDRRHFEAVWYGHQDVGGRENSLALPPIAAGGLPMKRIASSLLVVFLLVLFIAGLGHLFSLRFEQGDMYPPYSSLRADPMGLKVWFEALQRLTPLAV